MEWKARHGHGTTNSSLTEVEEEHLHAMFMKDFCDIDQLEHRYTIFKEALRDIDQHNAGYAIGVYNNNRCIDQFSHLIQEEYELRSRLLRVLGGDAVRGRITEGGRDPGALVAGIYSSVNLILG
ncbi:uncharacterized protein [Triticum aestivum]|uniref:uncharacterized protein n=1 Tax=Triticum aestivum TaxID=4565 RepID=UPI001D009D31|nr:uncharacterized protein LOC123059321 [Triticum aestivum]